MNISTNFNFSYAINSIKTVFESKALSTQQQKVAGVAALVFATILFVRIVYRYCFTSSDKVPPAMAEIFKKYHYNADQLPELDMTEFKGSCDYISYISLENMTSPVMRFTDAWGRKGIALALYQKESSTRQPKPDEPIDGKLSLDMPSSNKGVWTFHIRNSNQPKSWVATENDAIRRIFQERHEEKVVHKDAINACDKCLFTKQVMPSELLENLLTGNDPDFQLGKEAGFNLFSRY